MSETGPLEKCNGRHAAIGEEEERVGLCSVREILGVLKVPLVDWSSGKTVGVQVLKVLWAVVYLYSDM